MSNILNLSPKNISLRLSQLIEVVDDIYTDYASNPIDYVKHIFDTEYDLPEDITDLMFDWFGLSISDLKFFSTSDRERLKNLFLDNTFTFYRDRIKKDLYLQILYIYSVRGDVKVLNTGNWTDYYPEEEANYFDMNKYTDVGLYTDEDHDTDNVFRTPFVNIIIYLDVLRNDGTDDVLWYLAIDEAIKGDVENVRHVLSQPFYTLFLDVNGIEGETTINTGNSVECISNTIETVLNVKECKFTFSDDTTEFIEIDEKEETDDNYIFIINNEFSTDKNIKKIELIDSEDTYTYVEINFDNIYIKLGDEFLLHVTVERTITEDFVAFSSVYYYDYEEKDFDTDPIITRSFYS